MDGQEASMHRPSRVQSPQDQRSANHDHNISKPGDATMLPTTQAPTKQIEVHFGQKVPESTAKMVSATEHRKTIDQVMALRVNREMLFRK